jgi:hypothetical protein
VTTPTPIRKAGSVFALGMRVTLLGANGAPQTGAAASYVTDNLVKLDFTVEYRDGVEVERLNGAQKACLYYASNPTVKRLTIGGLELCGIGTELWSSAIADDGIVDDLPYIQWIFPREYLKPSDRSVSSDAFVAAFEGQGNQNPNWGSGPFNDWNHESGRVYQWARVAALPDLSANGFVTVPPAG